VFTAERSARKSYGCAAAASAHHAIGSAGT
jgi:hypothetical protein